ncbi:Rv3654c family TadE-like protein [Nocardioides ferulae]|uniref:Rv3654c family TadE-like protein n=1 Tax=Nocardioides ferulae TaxID=2340821 RepID=UPI000EABAFBB|nr:Rv3654c family TadE-like protein [Nocardioides ferulae]
MSRAGERGSATLFAVSCLALLLLLGAALSVVAALFVAHRSAQSAADLAALAAAAAAGRGGDACAAGAAVARANEASLVSCAPAGREVTVEVEVDGPRWLGQSSDLRALARAGPAG